MFFAAGSLRLYFLVLAREFVRSTMVGDSVVHGEPPWRMFQSRVLGPYLVHAVTVVTGRPLPEAYADCALAILFIAGLGVLVSTRRLRDPSRPALASFLLFQAGFLLLLPSLWLYVWDLISLVVFWVFNDFVMRGAPRLWFAALFGVAVLNHEIALAIAAWMVLDPIVRHVAAREDPRRPPLDTGGLVLGLGLAAGGVAVIATLRRVLLVRLSPPLEGSDLAARDWGDLQITLGQNWDSMGRSFTLSPGQTYQFVVPIFLVAVVLLAIRLAVIDLARFGALAIVMIAMVASFLCFGLVLETRVLMPLVPFVAMHGWAATRGHAATG